MRVNQRIFTERADMLDGIQIPNCPNQLRVVAERLVTMASKLGYSVGDYHTITELDKKLMVDYWQDYDMLNDCLDGFVKFNVWFPKHATEPDLITRARRWLVEHNYLILKEDVRERAIEAGRNMRQSIRGE